MSGDLEHSTKAPAPVELVLDCGSKTTLTYRFDKACTVCGGQYFIEQGGQAVLCLFCEMKVGGLDRLNIAGWKLIKTPFSVVAARL